MKRLFLILWLMPVLMSYGQEKSFSTVKTVATNWFHYVNKGRGSDTVINHQLYVYHDTAKIYIFNFLNGGYVITSADDRILPVLIYNSTCSQDTTYFSQDMKDMFYNYADQICFIIRHNYTTDETSNEWKSYSGGTFPPLVRVGPLLETKWAGWDPYFRVILCNNDTFLLGTQACVPLAMSQIIRYHKYPLHGSSSKSYQINTTCSGTVDFSQSTYNYNLMPDILKNSSCYPNPYDSAHWWDIVATQSEINAVGKLQFDCSVACNMDWGTGTYDNDVHNVGYDFYKYFKYCGDNYSYSLDIANHAYYENFKTKLKESISKNLPVFMAYIFWTSSIPHYRGHAFVIDGFTGNWYHVCMGLGGCNDGWFALFASDSIVPALGDSNHIVSNYFACANIHPPCEQYSGSDSLVFNINNGNNITWTTNKQGVQYVYVHSGGTLTVKSTVIFRNNGKITVENGGTLKIDGGELSPSCSCTGWQGIVVNGGGNLYTLNSGKIYINGNGKIFIDSTSSGVGKFYYSKSSLLVLTDDSSRIDIKGNLYIGDSANFNFSGNGYLRLSSTNSPSNNIKYATCSHLTLNGSGKTDKILEIAQETAFMPNCTITNGLVYMQHSEARMQAATETTTLDIEHVKFSPLSTNQTNERGLQVWGNQNCKIVDCDFENGKYGIYGYLTYGGTPLTINNCTFTNNWAALWIHDKALLVSNCTFSKNTYGYYAEFTSLDSNLINNCVFAAYPNGNTNPVMSNHCTGDIMMENSEIDYAPITAVYASGSHTFSAKCSDISGLVGGTYALKIDDGTTLNVSSSETSVEAGNCHIIAGSPLRFTQAYYFYIDNGHNYLNRTGGYHIYGTLTKYGCASRYPIIYARYNQWVSAISNYVTKYYNCTPTQVYTIDCSNPNIYSGCEVDSGGGVNPTKSLTINTDSNANNAAYQNGVNAMHNAENNGNWQTSFDMYAQVVSGNVPQPTMDNITLWENSWENMRRCLKEMYTLKQLSGYTNAAFLKTIAANEKMQELQADNYYRKFQLALDKATLYRMAGDYNTAISLATLLTADTSASNQRQADDWLCILNLEKRISEGLIPPSEVAQARAECSILNEPTENKSMEYIPDTNVVTLPANASWLKVIPNPAGNNAVLCVNAAGNEPCEVEITTLLGNPVEIIEVQGGYTETPVSFSKYSQGVYIVSLKKNGQVIAISRLTVSK